MYYYSPTKSLTWHCDPLSLRAHQHVHVHRCDWRAVGRSAHAPTALLAGFFQSGEAHPEVDLHSKQEGDLGKDGLQATDA